MDLEDNFQGVICCCLDIDGLTKDNLVELLDLKISSKHKGITCSNLELENKYYRTTIHLFDFNSLDNCSNKAENILENCQAIILHGNGMKITTEQLDDKLKIFNNVGGEPRVLLCYEIDEDCEPHKTLLDWCIKNGYNLILAGHEDAKSQLVDSLSAYKWTHRSNKPNLEDKPQLNDEVIKKLMDFDSLLGKLSAYRERPELRGNPDDKNIEEIAEILSGLLGDDVDDFLDNEEGNNNHLQEE